MPVVDIDRVLARVSRPGRYTGGEWNSVVKDWEATPLRFVLAYPDVYEIAAGSLGLNLLYAILNRQPDVLCERCFAPWPDLEAAMAEARLPRQVGAPPSESSGAPRPIGVPLWSLETRHPLAEFDVIGFSLVSELTYTNVLNMLSLAGLPRHTAERPDSLPLVVAGGPATINPEPLADFIDAFVLGEGDETVLDIAECVRQWKEGGKGKGELLGELARIPGVYVPSFYKVGYRDDGTIRAVEPSDAAAPPRPRARWLEKLPPPLTKPIVPLIDTGRDRAVIEIARGGDRGCCCGPGLLAWSPRRERSVQEVTAGATEVLANTGYPELSLIGTDHSQMEAMARGLRRALGEGITISLPGLRPEVASVEMADALAAGQRRQGITFVLAAGSERLRAALRHTQGQPLSDTDAVAAAEAAFARGWTSVKLHFRLGLPGENMEDVLALAALARQVKESGRRYHGGRARVRVQASIFVPKAWTPFQWAPMEGTEKLEAKAAALRKACKRAGVEFSSDEPERALLEAVLARGDRRLGAAIRRAWELGARLDGWREHFDWSRWEQALGECGLDAAFYAYRERGSTEKFPWSHLDFSVIEEQLREEWGRRRAVLR